MAGFTGLHDNGREIHRDRQTDRQTDRVTDRLTDRQTKTGIKKQTKGYRRTELAGFTGLHVAHGSSG